MMSLLIIVSNIKNNNHNGFFFNYKIVTRTHFEKFYSNYAISSPNLHTTHRKKSHIILVAVNLKINFVLLKL